MHTDKKLMLATILFATTAGAQDIDPFYAGTYTLTSLGKVTDLPSPYGPVLFKRGDDQTLLIGGEAERESAAIYEVAVVRNAEGLITGFSGTATKFADAPGEEVLSGLSGGLVYGPNNVIFYTTYSDNRCAQLKPGSLFPDTFTDLTTLGVTSSTGGVGIVPSGFGGTGRIKFTSYSSDEWYDGSITPIAGGTFDISDVSLQATLSGGPEGFVYVKAGQPLFTTDSVIVAEYVGDLIVTYQINANGDPLADTRRVLADMNESGPLGLAFDPVSGDLIISNYYADDVYKIHGFFPARCPVDYNDNGIGDACEFATPCGILGAGMTLMAPFAVMAMWVGRRKWTPANRTRR